MWGGSISHGTSCFGLMVGSVCGADPMKLLTPVVNKILCRLVEVP